MKKHGLCILLCALFLFSSPAFASGDEASYFKGNGTTEEPYLIETVDQLILLAERVNAGDGRYNAAHYLLTKDLDLEEKPWIPIGIKEETSFYGVFNGGGHILYNLSVASDVANTNYVALFGFLDGGTVRDLTVCGGSYGGGGDFAAGIVSQNTAGTVVNCCFNGFVISENSGGLVCLNLGGLVANCCFNDYYEQGNSNGSDIVMANELDGKVSNCYVFAQSGPGQVVSGFADSSTVENCYCYGFFDINDNLEYMYRHMFGGEIAVGCAFLTDESEVLTPFNNQPIIGGATTLLEALNAWVDEQDSSVYKRWIQVPGKHPMLGDYTITASVGEGGTILPAAEVFPAYAESSKTINIHPDDSHFIQDVLVDGKSVGAVAQYEFANIMSNHTIDVQFSKIGSMDNFKLDHEYIGYSDLDETQWYGTQHEGTIRDATKLGLVSGTGNGAFLPDAGVRLGEVVKMAAAIHNIYRGGDYVFDQASGANWWDTYVDYAVKNDIIAKNDFSDFNQFATRSHMAYILAHALPSTELQQTSTLVPPDITYDTLYFHEIISLYYAGILKGSDGEGTFRGDTGITRAEVSAIIVRLAIPDRRFNNLGG